MGLRTRLKSKVKAALGRGEAEATPTEAAPAAPAARSPSRAPAPSRTAPTSTATPPPRPPSPPAAASPAPASPEEAEAEAKKQAKIAKHREKTRKGVLKKLDELGGESELADLHDFSERRYFVAHRGFSELMEGLVAEGLLLFDHATNTATITEAGRAYHAS